ncbi:MAG: hypothetical protein J7M11_00430 [Elusimicrobia bacterium]|nr:hypothetical protein [Elusimicrobiota bacterium]
MSYYHGWPRYVPISEKIAKAQRKLKQLKKKNPDIKPVIVEGRTLAHSWWGKAWNSNLARYADYENRIGRGRSYVRNGNVLDLQIMPGKVEALVMGTSSSPYTVTIEIRPIKKALLLKIQKVCETKVESLQELLAGKFPKNLIEIFTAKGHGLFPSLRDIKFDCDCPDWANMCKHVAAVLYGIGVRFDKSPELFFELRKIQMKTLIKKAVAAKSKKLLKKSRKKTSRVIEDADISRIFNIDMADAAVPVKKTLNTPKSGAPPSKPLKKRKRTKRSKK